MITEHDLQEAIAECKGQRNPTANTCLKLAAFYTIKDKMFPEDNRIKVQHSYANNPTETEYESEFLEAASKVSQSELLSIMDELMSTVKIIVPRLYVGVMKKLIE